MEVPAFELLKSRETKQRLDGLAQLEDALSGSVTLEVADVTRIVDTLGPVISDNNPKLAQGALQLLQRVAQLPGTEFAAHAQHLWPQLIERMGDSKVTVRIAAAQTVVSCMEAVGPQHGVEKLRPAFEHKNPRAREQALSACAITLQRYGPRAAGVHLMLPAAVRLLEDSDPQVRDAAAVLLEHTYAAVGEPLIDELQRRGLRPAVERPLLERLGRVQSHATMTPAAAAALLRRKGDDHAGAHSGANGSAGGGAAPTASAAPMVKRASSPSMRAARAPSPRVGGPAGAGFARAAPAHGIAAPPDGAASDAVGDGGDAGALSPSADVRPLRVYSERELQRELDSICADLRDSTASDWTTRQAALRRLQALVLGGAAELGGEGAGPLLAALRPLREPLGSQLADLRSQIVKECCVTLTLLGGALGEPFADFFEHYTPQLLRLTGQSIAVIATSAHLCVRALIAKVRPPRIAPRLATAMSDRSAGVRVHSTEYLDLLARTLRPPAQEGERGPLDRHADVLINALKAAIHDALAEVRALARSAFWALSAHLPGQCRTLLDSLDAPTARLLEEEQARARGGPPLPQRSASTGVVERPRATSAPRRLASASHLSGVRGGAAERTAAAADARAAEAAGAPAPGPRLGSAASGAARVASRQAATANGGANGALGQISAMLSGISDGSAAAPGVPGSRASAARVEVASSVQQRGGFAGVAAVGGGARRVARADQRLSDREGGPSAASAQPTEQHNSSAAAMRQPTTGGHGGARAVEEAGMPAAGSAVLAGEEPLPSILAKRDDGMWSVRASCLTQVASLAGTEREAELLHPQSAERVVSCILAHVADVHYKVVLAALECICAAAHVLGPALEPALERLLPKLLARVHDPKDVIRSRADSAAGALRAAFGPSRLITPLVRTLDNTSPRIKSASLDQIAAVCEMPEATQHLAHAAHMRPCVHKAAGTLNEKSPELRRASAAALAGLYRAAPVSFVGVVALMPMTAQILIKRALADRAPELGAQISTHVRSGRPASRPAFPGTVGDRAGNGAAGDPAGHLPGPMDARLATEAMAEGDELAPTLLLRAGLPAPAQTTHVSRVAMPNAEQPAARAPLRETPAQGLQQRAAGTGAASVPQGDVASRAGLDSVPDPGAGTEWMALMPTLLRQLASGQSASAQRDSLLKIAKMTSILPPGDAVWQKHFEHVLEAELRLVESDDERVREAASQATWELVRKHTERTAQFTEHVMLRLLAAHRDTSHEVRRIAEECLETLAQAAEPRRCLGVLIPVTAREEAPVLQAAIRATSRVVQRIDASELNPLLPQLLPPLFDAFKSPSADVRKAVVFTLVDMYLVLGDALTPHLSELSTSQLKLVTIYINRTAKSRAEQQPSGVNA